MERLQVPFLDCLGEDRKHPIYASFSHGCFSLPLSKINEKKKFFGEEIKKAQDAYDVAVGVKRSAKLDS